MFLSIWKFLIVNFENYEVLTNLKLAANVNENENLIFKLEFQILYK